MPYTDKQDYATLLAPGKVRPNTVLIFYSDVDKETGEMWCPDCRNVDPIIKKAFEDSDKWNGVVVYIGSKPEWQDPNNKYKKDWYLRNMPCMIQIDSKGKEHSRLVEYAITEENVKTFLQFKNPE